MHFQLFDFIINCVCNSGWGIGADYAANHAFIPKACNFMRCRWKLVATTMHAVHFMRHHYDLNRRSAFDRAESGHSYALLTFSFEHLLHAWWWIEKMHIVLQHFATGSRLLLCFALRAFNAPPV